MPDQLNIPTKVTQTDPPQANGRVAATEFNNVVTQVNNSVNVSVDQTDVMTSSEQERGRGNLGITPADTAKAALTKPYVIIYRDGGEMIDRRLDEFRRERRQSRR